MCSKCPPRLTVFFLRGIDVVSPAEADTDVFVNVDVFGTIRSRTELHLYNAETLRAQTKLEYFAVDRNSRKLLIKPQNNSYEAKHQEKYALWMGPYKTDKNIKAADGLMVDFSDITPYDQTNPVSGSLKTSAEPNEPHTETPSRPRNEILRQRRSE